MAADKQHAHELIERLPLSQVPTAIGMLESLIGSTVPSTSVPVDDEPESEEEREAVAKSKAWFKQRGGGGTPDEEVLAEFGLSPDDLKNK